MKPLKSMQDLGRKAILITGGCGFIGVNLVKFLSEKNYDLRLLDNLSTGKKEYLDNMNLPNPPELFIGDIKNSETVAEAVEGMDAIVHLAAHPSVVASLENPEEVWNINVNGTLNLLEACRRNGVGRFIFASSNVALGEQTPPVDESRVPQPLSPYGAAKLAGEALCSAYYHSFGLRTISLRFANCYGAYSEHKTSVIARFMKCAKERKPLIIYGDGNQTRDLIHVDDICQAIHLSLMVAESGAPVLNPFGEVFQIASGEETTVNYLAQQIKELSGRGLPIIYQPERKGDIRRNYSDITKARRLLGFEPKVKLKEGLEGLYDSWERSKATLKTGWEETQ